VVQSTATNLKVDASGVAVPVTDNAGTLTVDAPVGTPVFVRLSDGSAAITTLPVSGTVTGNQGTAAAASSAWPVKVSDGTNTAALSNVSGSYAVKVDVVQAVGSSAQTDKAAFVEGTGKFEVVGGVYNETISSDPTEDQAAAARITAKRAIHINLRNLAGAEVGIAGAALRVDPTGTTAQPVSDGGGSITVDLLATTVGGATVKTADFDTGGGTDTVPMFGIALPKSGGSVAGGTATDPVRVDPTGTTTQPVSGTITAAQGGAPWSQNLTQIAGSAVVAAGAGIQKVGITDNAGAAFSYTHPLPVTQVPQEQTQWRQAKTYAATETDIAIFTPTGGKKFAVLGVIVSPTATGVVKIYDNTNSATNMLFQGTPGGTTPSAIAFSTPWISSAINNVLRYSTGAAATGDITVYGYEV
jgi:hypothetical protein